LAKPLQQSAIKYIRIEEIIRRSSTLKSWSLMHSAVKRWRIEQEWAKLGLKRVIMVGSEARPCRIL
jgi:hypothetical protein